MFPDILLASCLSHTGHVTFCHFLRMSSAECPEKGIPSFPQSVFFVHLSCHTRDGSHCAPRLWQEEDGAQADAKCQSRNSELSQPRKTQESPKASQSSAYHFPLHAWVRVISASPPRSREPQDPGPV